MFNVINVKTNVVVKTNIKDGKEAAKIALALTNSTKEKHQPRLIVDDNWKIRELEKFTKGVYKPVPWAKAKFAQRHADHFVHVSLIDCHTSDMLFWSGV